MAAKPRKTSPPAGRQGPSGPQPISTRLNDGKRRFGSAFIDFDKAKKAKAGKKSISRSISTKKGEGASRKESFRPGGSALKAFLATQGKPKKTKLSSQLLSVASAVGPGRTSIGRAVKAGLTGAALGTIFDERRAEKKKERAKAKKDAK